MTSRVLLFTLAFFLFAPSADAARIWSNGCEIQGDGVAGSINMASDGEFSRSVSGTTANYNQIWPTVKRTGLSSCRHVATSTPGIAPASHVFINGSAATATAMYFRVYIYIETAPSVRVPALGFWDQGIDGTEGSVEISTNRYLVYTDDDRTVLGTSTSQLALDTWYRLEVKYDAGDSVVVRLDGVDQITVGAHDGDSIDAFRVGFSDDSLGPTATGEFLYDDIAINTSFTASHNSYPGPGSIVYFQPNAAGDNNNCSVGDYTSVDEITPDDGATYCNLDLDAGSELFDVNVETSTSAGIDSYDTITLVHVSLRQAQASAASATFAPRLKSASGGTVTTGTSVASVSTSYFINDDTEARNPGITSLTDPTTGIAWTPTGTNSLDNMQVGVSCTDCNPDTRVTQLYAIVEYVDGSPPAGGILRNPIIWWD